MMETITLTTNWNKRAEAQAVPGCFYDERAFKVDRAGITPRTAAIILRLFPHALIENPWLADIRPAGGPSSRPADFATPYVEKHGTFLFERVEAILHAKGWSLHEYQLNDLTYLRAFLEHHHGGYLGWQMGLGKTLGTCALIDGLDHNFNLIICPNSAKRAVWEPALAEFVPWIPTYVMPNAKAKREALIDELTGRVDPYNLVCHYEALPIIAGSEETASGAWRPGKGWARLGAFDLIVCDEGHRLKNMKAKFVKALKVIDSHDRLLLSGSVVENALEELWSPLNWLFPKHYTAKWRQWNSRYLDYVEGNFGKVCIGPKEETLDDLKQELGRFLCYRRSGDELDIPTPHRRDIRVDLSASQRRVYSELERTLRTVLDDGTEHYVEEGLSLLSKLRQVATGLDLLGDVADSTKLDTAEELIRDGLEQGEVFVVFAWYKASLNALADRLGRDSVYVIHGDRTQKQRDEALVDFSAGGHPVILASIATLAESVNLQRASQVIFLDRDWNPAKNEQAEARVVRQGQTKNVGVTHIIARSTVDELNVQPTLKSKEALRALILGG